MKYSTKGAALRKEPHRSIESHDVKVDVALTKLEPFYTEWVMDYHKEMQSSPSVVKNRLS